MKKLLLILPFLLLTFFTVGVWQHMAWLSYGTVYFALAVLFYLKISKKIDSNYLKISKIHEIVSVLALAVFIFLLQFEIIRSYHSILFSLPLFFLLSFVTAFLLFSHLFFSLPKKEQKFSFKLTILNRKFSRFYFFAVAFILLKILYLIYQGDKLQEIIGLIFAFLLGTNLLINRKILIFFETQVTEKLQQIQATCRDFNFFEELWEIKTVAFSSQKLLTDGLFEINELEHRRTVKRKTVQKIILALLKNTPQTPIQKTENNLQLPEYKQITYSTQEITAVDKDENTFSLKSSAKEELGKIWTHFLYKNDKLLAKIHLTDNSILEAKQVVNRFNKLNINTVALSSTQQLTMERQLQNLNLDKCYADLDSAKQKNLLQALNKKAPSLWVNLKNKKLHAHLKDKILKISLLDENKIPILQLLPLLDFSKNLQNSFHLLANFILIYNAIILLICLIFPVHFLFLFLLSFIFYNFNFLIIRKLQNKLA